jgi:hypothetical protein
MLTMTDRPTPEQIADEWHGTNGVTQRFARHDLLDQLTQVGYVIVHPDDIPTAQFASADFQRGWYGCRNLIFGDAIDD